MFVVHVHVTVKKDRIDEFIAATRENATSSIQEKGVYRFDVFQQEEAPNQFILEEVYLTPADSGSHKDTTHYKKWKNLVENMMAEPRRSTRLHNIHPKDEAWKKG